MTTKEKIEKLSKAVGLIFWFDRCVKALPDTLSKTEVNTYFEDNNSILSKTINNVVVNDTVMVRVGERDIDYAFFGRNQMQQIFEEVNEQGIVSFFHASDLSTTRNIEVIKRFYSTIPHYIEKQQIIQCCKFDKERSRNACLIFGEEDLSHIRSDYDINLNETLLFIDEHYYDAGFILYDWYFSYGIVITDAGIYCRYYKQKAPNTIFSFGNKENDKQLCFLSWGDFNKVVYKELVFYFYFGKELVAQIEKKVLCDGLIAEKCKQLAEDLTSMSQLVGPNLSVFELAEQGLYDEALQKVEDIINSGDDVSFGYLAKAQVLRMKELEKMDKNPPYEESDEVKKNLENVIRELRKAIKAKDATDDKDKKEFVSQVLFCMADTENYLGHYTEARNHYIEGLGDCDDKDKDESMEALIDVEGSLKETWDNYSSIYRYKDRKFIMPIRDNEIGGCITAGITTFRMSNIPSCMKFPMGHPIANQLYIGHPFNPSLYVPYEQSEELFFLDKVHEIRYLFECLGAEEITITSIKGKEVTELRDSSNHYSVDGGMKRFSAGVEVNTQYKNQNDSSSHSHRSMMVKLDPLQRPFLPDGLIWYNEMPQWQRLVQSRLQGNLLEYSEFVSTAETKFTSSSEMTDIKASAKFLWAKAHAEVNECFEKQFKESTETQWKVDVKFRSMKNFENEVIETVESEEAETINQIGLSKEELEYAEEVRFCLEDDGIIDDSERRLLERKRIKLGISQERAAEIENSLLRPQLTEDEKEYLEAVKEELVEGMIPDASRRLLDRLRKRMDISDERAKEIEMMAGNRWY